MNPKLTLAIVLFAFALADARNTNFNVTSTIRLQTSIDPLTPAAEELLAADQALNKEISWKVSVRTSDVFWAGTSANVFICIYGDKGKSDDITLDNAENNFERSHTDTFRITTPDLGKPYKIRVWHDNSGRYPGWNFRNVKLERYETGDKYTFNCECWLTRSKGLSIEIPLDA